MKDKDEFRPVLFDGEYDLNVMAERRILDPDAFDAADRRFPLREHDVLEKARWAGLAVACLTPGGLARDVFSARDARGAGEPSVDSEPWDLYLTLGSEENLWPEDVYVAARAGTPEGEAFLARYLPTCRVRFECRNCTAELVGQECFRNRCLCQGCEDLMPDYFERPGTA